MTPRQRVLQLVYSFHEAEGGGVTRFAFDLAGALNPQEFAVEVWALAFHGSPAEEQQRQQWETHGVRTFHGPLWQAKRPYRSFWRAYRALFREVAQRPFDLVHSHSEFTDILALGLKVQGKAPRILRTVHYGHPLEWHRRPLRRWLLTDVLYPLFFDGEIGVSPQRTERLNRRMVSRWLKRQALYVPVGLEVARFRHRKVEREAKRRSLGLPAEAFLIISVGRLVEQKGHTFLLHAAAQVVRQYPLARFLILGEGPLAASLRALRDQLGLQGHVIFAGARSDVAEWLACSDLMVASSLWEGLPLAVMEGMASGLPLVASDLPGVRVLVGEEQAWLVPPGQPQALAEAILEAMASETQRATKGRRAQEAVQAYAIEGVARRYEEIYRALLEGQRLPGPNGTEPPPGSPPNR